MSATPYESLLEPNQLAAVEQVEAAERLAASEVVEVDPVRQYLKSIGRVPLLDAAEEVALAQQTEAGVLAQELLDNPDYFEQRLTALRPDNDSTALRQELQQVSQQGVAAMHHMIEANLRLVVSMAKNQQGKGLSILDLIQEGNLGLHRAVEGFDFTKGFKFSTYAAWWIRQKLGAAVASQARISETEPQSLQDEVGHDGLTIEDMVAVDPDAQPLDIYIASETVQRLVAAVDALRDPETRQVVAGYYGVHAAPQRVEDVANAMDISPRKARRLLENGRKLLRARAAHEDWPERHEYGEAPARNKKSAP